MLLNKDDMHVWKIQQIEYFKEYLNNFDINSREYLLIKSGIEKLEDSLQNYVATNN